MSDFADKLHSLTSRELSEAMQANDHVRIGAAIELLARAVGFTLAIATNGNQSGVDEMMVGVEKYIHEEAVSKSKLAAIFETISHKR